ncbi:MAG TPA: 3-mercaptopyruvate sulfurtransferase [Afifellaceae bacterium]|nr:3-mercaptopyruvate sulfurtransferase [Afifellaceae bacterium]
MTRPTVTAEWLHANLGRDDVRIVDASWFLPNQNRDGHAEYLHEHIPGAVYFPIDEIADTSSSLPHMLPAAGQFAEAAGAMGIARDDTIVVYDAVGLFSAARVWWTFRYFGAPDVFVLDGGLPAWKRAGYPTESRPVTVEPRHFEARPDAPSVSDHLAIKAALASGTRQVVDARSRERFAGSAPEPRPELPSGHMPGAFNLPFQDVLDGEGRLLPAEAIRGKFEAAGVDLEKPVTTTCGSGVTAAILTLALTAAGHDDLSLYDGSWTEWASRDDCPRETDTP